MNTLSHRAVYFGTRCSK